MGSIASTAGRAALLVAAGVATVCGASALSGQRLFSMGAIHPERALSAAVADQQQQLLLDLYTRGPLLDTVQRARVFNDSKHFVDMPVKTSSTPTQILTEFKDVVQPALQANPAATNETLLAFLNKHFDEPGSEIRKTVPRDFTEFPTPPLLSTIQNPDYKTWALALHGLWKELGRSPDRDAVSSYLHPTPLASLGDTSTSTVIVVPGGRFRESYYWDSYWIVKGLMVSNMQTTARRVTQNLLEYVAEYGFVPNGGRIYYLNRSQPPLLSDMVRVVATKNVRSMTGTRGDKGVPATAPEWDLDYLRGVVPILEKEYDYWMTQHGIPVNILGVSVTLNVYNATVDSPRPESYREDVLLAEKLFPGDTAQQGMLYKDIASAAESGWDFSSRWFADQASLATIRTTDVVPVDLNAILYRVETNLAEFNKLLGNEAAFDKYSKASATRSIAFQYGFWHEESSSWHDLVISTSQPSPTVAVSNYFPLWAGAIRDRNGTIMQDRLDRAVKSLRDSGLIQVAGVQTTTKATGEQWDAPNAWPPLQDILVEGLIKADTADSRKLAQELVQTWIKTTFAAWKQTGLMFEKYNATIVGGLGAGGEYVPQFGFGWTNGVVLKFLTEYKDFLQ